MISFKLMLEYQSMRYCRYRLSERPKQTFLSRALEGFSRLLEKILSILKSPKGNRIRKQKIEEAGRIEPQRIKVAGRIEPQRIKPPERLPRPGKIQPKVLGRDGKIKPYKGRRFRKLNRFR
jgi:hypothetical protein